MEADVWESRRQELMSGDDPAARWLRLLSVPPAEPERQAPAPVTGHAEWRRQLDLDHRGFGGQVQQLGYRGDTPLLPPMTGADHVRAAAALGHDFGADARAEYARRQHAAAQAINGIRR